MAVFIHLSVFPYPETPQIFISITFFLIPTILILDPIIIFALIIGGEICFLSLCFQFKTNACIEQDVFNSIASMFFSFIIMGITLRLRIRAYITSRNYQELYKKDRLTGLLNKVEFENQCSLFIEKRNTADYIALMVIDLDNFKQINDTYGHSCGDLLLQYVSQ